MPRYTQVEALLHESASQYRKCNLKTSQRLLDQALKLRPDWYDLFSIITDMEAQIRPARLPEAFSAYIGRNMPTEPPIDLVMAHAMRGTNRLVLARAA